MTIAARKLFQRIAQGGLAGRFCQAPSSAIATSSSPSSSTTSTSLFSKAFRRPFCAPSQSATAAGAAEAEAGAAAAAAAPGGVEVVPRPTPIQLRRLFINSAVPFVAFGIVDQSVLIYAGETIDSTLGVGLGLPTLGAAAMGQVCSDTTGVLCGGAIEAAALKLGLPLPGLTDAQRTLGVVKRVGTAGQVVGVIIGCLIGMLNLLVVDLAATERAKKAEELKKMMKAVIEDGAQVVNCKRATLWIVDEETNELWTSFASGLDKELRVPLDSGSLAGWTAANQQMRNIPNVQKDPLWSGNAKKPQEWVPQTMICIPVLKNGKTLGVIQMMDKISGKDKVVAFDQNDEKLLKMLAGHIAIFMGDDEDEDEAEGGVLGAMKKTLGF